MNILKRIATWIIEPHGNEGYIEAQNRVLTLIVISNIAMSLGMVLIFYLMGKGDFLNAMFEGGALYTLCCIVFLIVFVVGMFLYHMYEVFIRN
ncbi:TPA: hypothetical protein MO340_004200 [Salmonella enterica subsp. salamae serovar 35:g,m,s,t:-]|nr:hypothetical protein [Salmonella enterica subsp. salamae serovar 35:g,m,s,t:-]HCA3549672.1 hypothetical protein [Salmonella enterica subsp. salamae serovar 35:g,m,s,t:-]